MSRNSRFTTCQPCEISGVISSLPDVTVFCPSDRGKDVSVSLIGDSDSGHGPESTGNWCDWPTFSPGCQSVTAGSRGKPAGDSQTTLRKCRLSPLLRGPSATPLEQRPTPATARLAPTGIDVLEPVR